MTEAELSLSVSVAVFTLVQKEETLAMASSPWFTAFVSKFIKTEMESVGRAIARHGVSNKQRKTNREPKKQNYQGNDRHKAPGRIVSSGKKRDQIEIHHHTYWRCILFNCASPSCTSTIQSKAVSAALNITVWQAI